MEIDDVKENLKRLVAMAASPEFNDDAVLYFVFDTVRQSHVTAQMLLLEGRFPELQRCLDLTRAALSTASKRVGLTSGDASAIAMGVYSSCTDPPAARLPRTSGSSAMSREVSEDVFLLNSLGARTEQLQKHLEAARLSRHGRDTNYYLGKLLGSEPTSAAPPSTRVTDCRGRAVELGWSYNADGGAVEATGSSLHQPPERGVSIGRRTKLNRWRVLRELPPLVTSAATFLGGGGRAATSTLQASAARALDTEGCAAAPAPPTELAPSMSSACAPLPSLAAAPGAVGRRGSARAPHAPPALAASAVDAADDSETDSDDAVAPTTTVVQSTAAALHFFTSPPPAGPSTNSDGAAHSLPPTSFRSHRPRQSLTGEWAPDCRVAGDASSSTVNPSPMGSTQSTECATQRLARRPKPSNLVQLISGGREAKRRGQTPRSPDPTAGGRAVTVAATRLARPPRSARAATLTPGQSTMDKPAPVASEACTPPLTPASTTSELAAEAADALAAMDPLLRSAIAVRSANRLVEDIERGLKSTLAQSQSLLSSVRPARAMSQSSCLVSPLASAGEPEIAASLATVMSAPSFAVAQGSSQSQPSATLSSSRAPGDATSVADASSAALFADRVAVAEQSSRPSLTPDALASLRQLCVQYEVNSRQTQTEVDLLRARAAAHRSALLSGKRSAVQPLLQGRGAWLGRGSTGARRSTSLLSSNSSGSAAMVSSPPSAVVASGSGSAAVLSLPGVPRAHRGNGGDSSGAASPSASEGDSAAASPSDAGSARETRAAHCSDGVPGAPAVPVAPRNYLHAAHAAVSPVQAQLACDEVRDSAGSSHCEAAHEATVSTAEAVAEDKEEEKKEEEEEETPLPALFRCAQQRLSCAPAAADEASGRPAGSWTAACARPVVEVQDRLAYLRQLPLRQARRAPELGGALEEDAAYQTVCKHYRAREKELQDMAANPFLAPFSHTASARTTRSTPPLPASVDAALATVRAHCAGMEDAARGETAGGERPHAGIPPLLHSLAATRLQRVWRGFAARKERQRRCEAVTAQRERAIEVDRTVLRLQLWCRLVAARRALRTRRQRRDRLVEERLREECLFFTAVSAGTSWAGCENSSASQHSGAFSATMPPFSSLHMTHATLSPVTTPERSLPVAHVPCADTLPAPSSELRLATEVETVVTHRVHAEVAASESPLPHGRTALVATLPFPHGPSQASACTDPSAAALQIEVRGVEKSRTHSAESAQRVRAAIVIQRAVRARSARRQTDAVGTALLFAALLTGKQSAKEVFRALRQKNSPDGMTATDGNDEALSCFSERTTRPDYLTQWQPADAVLLRLQGSYGPSACSDRHSMDESFLQHAEASATRLLSTPPF